MSTSFQAYPDLSRDVMFSSILTVVLQLELFREMATIGELPYDLLHFIILLLVQSPGGVVDFARIISVCRKFCLFTQDKHILELVNFDVKMELKNFKRYQHINSLLVKCSEAGNVAAQFLLGKVILVSSSHLLLGEWHKVERDFHPCDFATLSELSSILATNVPTQNHEFGSFMAYFLPKQVSISEFSSTRLVHYQLVKLFLLNGSLHDLAEMSVFLKCYIKYFTNVTKNDPLLKTVILVSSSQLLLSGWQKAECDMHPCDFAKLSEISCVLATNVPAQDCEVVSFMGYFLPEQVSTSESQTRLVHFQLVKLFLRNGSLHDLTEMYVFLKWYIMFFIGVTEDDPLHKSVLKSVLNSIDALAFHEQAVKNFGNTLMELNRRFAGCADYEGLSNAIREYIDELNSHIPEYRALIIRFIELKLE